MYLKVHMLMRTCGDRSILELMEALHSFCVDFSLVLHIIISESSAVRSIFLYSTFRIMYCRPGECVSSYICFFFLPFNVGFFKLLSIPKLSPYWKLFKQVDTVLKSKKYFFSLYFEDSRTI